MKTTIRTAQLVLVGSALLLMTTGMVVWAGGGRGAAWLSPLHALLGIALAGSLWTLAAIAARRGVPPVAVTLAVAWSIAAITLALVQRELLTGDRHWTIQALHVATAMGMVAWGQGLVLLTRRAAARRSVGSSLGPAPVAKRTRSTAPSGS